MHTVVRVYNNGSRQTHRFQTVDEMKAHLEYSMTARLGCAHFRDGKCVSFGYLGPDRCQTIEQELLAEADVLAALANRKRAYGAV